MSSSFKMTELFINAVILKMDENLNRIKHCLGIADNDLLWKRPNVSSNSMGHLILHLNGNITQYIISCLGGEIDDRKRQAEFDTEKHIENSALLQRHVDTINKANAVIKSLDSKQLEKSYKVQGFDMTGVDILVHVTEHYSYHTGQIAFWLKLNLNTDLGFYKDQDLDVRNA